MILGDAPKRLGIYFFYDGDGVVDSYVESMLAEVRKQVTDLTVVVNGEVSSKGYARLNAHASKLILRENTGLDVWAYKTALDDYGWERLCEYDELVLLNSTIMGPVYPFSEMFSEMAKRDIDFWGVTCFHQVDYDPFGTTPEGYIPRHLQSHFHVYRQSLVRSPEFQEYWDNMPQISSYLDSVGMHEIPFTQRFERLGFVSDVYVNTEDLEGYTYQPILFAPKQLVAEKRCPVFKRRSFFHDYEDVLDQSVGNAALDLYEYLRDHTDFDTNLIWDNALRTMDLAELVKNLQLTYVLPTRSVATQPREQRVALIMHVHYMDLLPGLLKYAQSMPEHADLIVTVGSEEKAETVRQACADMPHRLIVRVIQNRGRDVAALLVGAKGLVPNYDLVCFVHDKKVTQIQPGSVGDGFAIKCFDNVLASPEFVSNVIALFDQEPRLGLLTPTSPNHGDYFPISAFSWGPNLPRTRMLLRELGVRVPLDENKGLVAPLGSTFWFRPKALEAMFANDWDWEDFPPEPLGGDGTISHAIERSHCYVAQGAGYFSGWLFSDRFARIELTNLSFYTRELTRAVAGHWQAGREREMVATVRSSKSVREVVKERINDAVPRVLKPVARLTYRTARRVRKSLR